MIPMHINIVMQLVVQIMASTYMFLEFVKKVLVSDEVIEKRKKTKKKIPVASKHLIIILA